jgi:hypothetical protein
VAVTGDLEVALAHIAEPSADGTGAVKLVVHPPGR